MTESIMRVIVGRIARRHGGEVREGRPGVHRRTSYLGVADVENAKVDRVSAAGTRAGLGAAHTSAAPDLGIVVWWDGSRLEKK